MDHKSRTHALLSASGSTRWMNCPPSARLEDKSGLSGDSVYGAEGTLAHEFSELELSYASKRIPKKEYEDKIKVLRENELYYPDMEIEIQPYIEYVLGEFEVAKTRTSGTPILMIEKKVDLSRYIEEGKGTCDSIIIADGIMETPDLKFGKGVRVSAEDNSQLKLYALGALDEMDMLYDIHTIRLTICQPRLDHIDSWDISKEELYKWAEEVLKPAAVKAFKGEGETKVGDWCRFCKVKSKCRAMHDENMKIAKFEFQDPMLLSDDEVLTVYKAADQFSDWLNGINDFVLKEAVRGKKWTGFKLVEGRSNRAWSDANKVEEILISEKFKKEDFTTVKIQGIGHVEKLVGKNRFPILFADCISKTQGKPTLVNESDKRPEFGADRAKDDFMDELSK